MLRAGIRDASCIDLPDMRGVRRYHIEVSDGEGACGVRNLLSPTDMLPAHHVIKRLRCRRPGCVQRWADVPEPPEN